MKKLLRGEDHIRIDVNAKDPKGDAYIHMLVRKIVTSRPGQKKIALECLWTFLVYCDSTHFDIDIVSNMDGNTALHVAVLVSLVIMEQIY